MKKTREGSLSTTSSEENVLIHQLLPVEIQSELVNTLPVFDILNLSLVSKHFYRLTHYPYTWRLIVERTWGIREFAKVPKHFDWKKYYREKIAFSQPLNWHEIDVDPHPPPRQSHGATKVGDKMIILGGHQVIGESFQRQDDMWSFDTTTNKFDQILPKGSDLPAMSRHRILTMGNKIYSFGGILQNKKKLNSIFTFDLDTQVWQELRALGSPPEPRCDPVVVSHNSNIIVFGGSVQDLVFPSDLHIFNTLTQTWTQPVTIGVAPPARIGCTGVVIGDFMYIYGGGDYDKEKKKYITLFTEIWALNLHNFEWTHIPAVGDVPNIMDFLNSFVVGNHLVIEGGWYSEPYAFDTVSRRWMKLNNHSEKKVNNNDASATLIGNAVYYFGGYHNSYKHHLYKLDISHLSFLL